MSGNRTSRPGRPVAANWVATGLSACCAAVALGDVAYLLDGAVPVALVLPLGLPGQQMVLALDGPGGLAMLLPAALGLAVARLDPVRAAGLLAILALTVLAGDAFTLATCAAAVPLVSGWATWPEGRDRAIRVQRRRQTGRAALAASCLVLALALLAGSSGDGTFAALRAHPPEGWRSTIVMMLALTSTGAALGPWSVPLTPVAVLVWQGLTSVSAYAFIRVVFDLAGPLHPMAWSIPALLLGCFGASAAMRRANLAPDAAGVLASAAAGQGGVAIAALGLALAARASDLSGLAAMALGAALLVLLVQGLAGAALALALAAVRRSAGSQDLARLGGLIHTMPATGLAALVGAWGLACLPPGPGFAGAWLLLQAILAAPRLGDVPWQAFMLAVAASLGVTLALAATAGLRLLGIVFLGRPRSPRAAAADEAPRALRLALAGLAGSALLAGVFSAALLALAAPALRQFAGADLSAVAGASGLASGLTFGSAATRYAPLSVMLAAGAGCVLARRLLSRRSPRSVPAWEGGMGPSPEWLPFGDPATQAGPAGLGQPWRGGTPG